MEIHDWDDLCELLEKHSWSLTLKANGAWVLTENIATFDSPEHVMRWILQEFELK